MDSAFTIKAKLQRIVVFLIIHVFFLNLSGMSYMDSGLVKAKLQRIVVFLKQDARKACSLSKVSF